MIDMQKAVEVIGSAIAAHDRIVFLAITMWTE
jgi:hypothetical protein